MEPTNINATNMIWQPPMLKLTQVGNPVVDGGKPTILYVSPSAINRINRDQVAFNNLDGSRSESFVCTTLHCCHFTCLVIESPETVALLRDKAFGHQTELKTV